MGTLYLSEIKKIIKKKSVLISLAAGLLIIVLLIFTYISSDGHMDYIKKQREVLGNLTGQKMDEEFFDNYNNEVNKQLDDNSDMYKALMAYDPGTAFMNASDAVYKKNLFDQILDVVRERDKVSGTNAEQFYDMMRKNIIDDGEKYLSVSADDMEIWLEEYDSVEKPVTYTYALGYSNIVDVLYVVGWVLFIIIAISLSGVFADEKINRTDAIILSSRRGRAPLCVAKILAGITVALAESVLIFGLCCLLILSVYGFEGADGVIQNIMPSSPWNITIGEMMRIYILLAVVTGILFAMSNMLLSHLTKSPVITMAVHSGILFGGLFSIPETMGIINKIWQLRPTLALYYATFLNTFRYGPFDNVQMSLIVYGLTAIIFMAVLIVSYRKSQVESR